MKFLLVLVVCCAVICKGYTQNIIQIEHFIDSDPGYGAGTAVAFAPASSVSTSFAVPVPAALTDGLHRLFVRAKDANNKWSIVAMNIFVKETAYTAPLLNIVAVESFIDNDPGYGAGTAVAFAPASSVSTSFTVPVPAALTDGLHRLFVRAKDASNKWSVVAMNLFVKETATLAVLPSIVQLEYFVDNDPGFGAGVAVGIGVTNPTTVAFNVGLSGFVAGAHKLFIRAKDTNGKWSMVATHDFSVQSNVIDLAANFYNVCLGTSLAVPFIATGGYNSGNVFTAQLSDATGDFANATNLGGLSTTAASGTITGTVPIGLTVSSAYKVRVVSSNPAIVGNYSINNVLVETCNPCPTARTLSSPTNDYLNNILSRKALQNITANNLVMGPSSITYTAGASITLTPGFRADAGTTFIAKIGGCP